MFSLVNKHEEFFDFLVTNGEYFHKVTIRRSWNAVPRKQRKLSILLTE